MKILYGVQGTGNGHISRANAMQKSLANHPEAELTWLLSGREQNALFSAAGDCLWRRGLTFVSRDGKVKCLDTFRVNRFREFFKDVNEMDLSGFDTVVTDYEPVISWAARKQGVKTIGIGHQYAFDYDVPSAGSNFFNRKLMKYFAPADIGLGLHWHHFGQPILPPICDLDDLSRDRVDVNKVLVYLPFDNQKRIITILRNIVDKDFYIYSADLSFEDSNNIHTRPLSKQGFKEDLVTSGHVICGSGFELISECLKLGIRVLTKPLASQVEQLSNAQALRELEYATVTDLISERVVGDWLADNNSVQIDYPNVHECLADWLVSEARLSVEALSEKLWRKVVVTRN